MEHKNNGHHGSGFLAGVIVGVVITLLFTTKKGREIFKETVDKVIDKFNDVKTNLDEEVILDEVEGDDYVKPESAPSPKEHKKEVRYLASESQEEVEGAAEEIEIEDVPEEKPEAPKKSSSVRKFFKLKKS